MGRKGFSLVSVLIAAGLIGILAIGLASLFTNAHQAQARIEAKQDVLTLTDEIRMLLSSPTYCSAAIGTNQDFDLGKADNIEVKDGGLGFRLKLFSGLSIEKGAELPEYRLKTVDFFFNRAVESGVDASGNKIYLGIINGQFSSTRQNSTLFALKQMGTAKLLVSPGNKIVGCSADEAGGPQNGECANPLGNPKVVRGVSTPPYTGVITQPDGTSIDIGFYPNQALLKNKVYPSGSHLRSSYMEGSISCQTSFSCINGVWIGVPYSCQPVGSGEGDGT